MTGKKGKNIGQRSRYYVRNSHPAIVSVEVFDKVQKEMVRRARLVHKEDGTVESSASKYNGKYLLGNLLVCGDCGATYRRRTERGKVVWRCATRIEKGKQQCSNSPTLDEEWVKNVLMKTVLHSNIGADEMKNYLKKHTEELLVNDEKLIRQIIERIVIFEDKLTIKFKSDGEADIYTNI